MSRIIANNIRHNDATADSLSFDSSARVGIGTSSPSQLLTVQTDGTSTTAGGNIAARLQANALNRAVTLQFSDNVSHSSTISMVGSATVFHQAGTEELRIQSGGGISFNGDTAAANALDDYEEGSWDPTITASTGTITVNSTYNTLSYTKIGRMVHIYGHIRIGSISGWGPGNIDINGLPYTVATSVEDGRGACNVVLYDSNASTPYKISVMPFYFIESSTKIQLAADRWNGGFTPGVGDEFHISGSYVAA